MLKLCRNITAILLALVFFLLPTHAAPSMPAVNAKSAILMEASSGRVLGAFNADEALPPASVTKIMTLLLVMEAIEAGQIALDDLVTVSANAASMGGSQIYLKEGEQMSVDELVKSVTVASANDAAVALAEHIAGSEAVFVARMNERAAELGMANTHFENTNGLDDTVTAHLTSARDIAIMSRALIAHPKILEYSGIWMDTIRDGAFGLTNTNRLIRFYRGATGLKTGSTSRAGFCISATAERDGMHLIAVIMGAPTRDIRNDAAKTMLDWGFSTYALYRHTPEDLPAIGVSGGVVRECPLVCASFSAVIARGSEGRVVAAVELPEAVPAPVTAGETVGRIVYTLDGDCVGEVEICAAESVERIGYWGLFSRILKKSLCG